MDSKSELAISTISYTSTMIRSALLILPFFYLIIQSGANAQSALPIPNENSDQPKKLRDQSVRMIYLVSSDRSIDEDYRKAIESAALNVQNFYRKKLDGLTFRLNEPVVEVVQCDKAASYFYSNPSDKNPENWGYFNAFNEVSRLLGAKFFDTRYTWVIYSDGPGDKGRGGSAVCVMPENDLLGLSGKHLKEPDINRWIGGLAHELGHAFGLNHPAETSKHEKAIMWTGIYGHYPEQAYFTEEDEKILKNSIFFSKGSSKKIYYPEGHFEGGVEPGSKWIEYKKNNSIRFEFTLLQKTDTFFILKSTDRQMLIKLPADGVQSYLSVDGGKSWKDWWPMY